MFMRTQKNVTSDLKPSPLLVFAVLESFSYIARKIHVNISLLYWQAEWIRRPHYTWSGFQGRISATLCWSCSRSVVLRFSVAKPRAVRDLAFFRPYDIPGQPAAFSCYRRGTHWFCGMDLSLNCYSPEYEIRISSSFPQKTCLSVIRSQLSYFVNKIPFNVFSQLWYGLPSILLLWGISSKLQ
jgi:hypothetical protein